MQPYFFPYISYFQLIHAVDHFVFFDDVSFRKKGRINRNYIINSQDRHLLTFPVLKVSQNKNINEHYFCDEPAVTKSMLNAIRHAYSKAPFFKEMFPVLEELFWFSDRRCSSFLENSLIKLSSLLNLKTKFSSSSSLEILPGHNGEDKIIQTVKALSGNVYINASNGRGLYSEEKFLREGLKLKFIDTNEIRYDQRHGSYVEYLSIIDTLMFIGPAETSRLVETEYQLT